MVGSLYTWDEYITEKLITLFCQQSQRNETVKKFRALTCFFTHSIQSHQRCPKTQIKRVVKYKPKVS